MIIDKVAPFWTEEDLKRLDEIITEMERLGNGAEDISSPEIVNAFMEQDSLRQRLTSEVEERYIKSFSRKPTRIYDDVKEIVGAIEKEDFTEANARLRENLVKLEKEAPEAVGNEPRFAELKKAAVDNYDNCFFFIMQKLIPQENALYHYYKGSPQSEARVRKIVDTQVTKWYVKPDPAYLPMLHGKPLDAFAYMNSKEAELNALGNAIIEERQVKLVIEKFTDLKATLGVNTDKLLSTAVAAFTKNNSHKGGGNLEKEVTISLKDYARRLGYDVDEHETDSPEAAKKEKARAKNELKNARKSVKKDLDILYACSLEWEERIGGDIENFSKRRIVQGVDIKSGTIFITFGDDIAKYLIRRKLITQYPTALIGLDARKPNAYYIGRKLAEHYYIDNNVKRGTYNHIGVKTLLKVTELPSYEEDPGHWWGRIKEPFERALDELTSGGVLTDWKYTHRKGVDLTEEEAYNIADYETFSGLYIEYELKDPEDQTDRIEEKDRRREEQRKRNAQRKRKQKKAES